MKIHLWFLLFLVLINFNSFSQSEASELYINGNAYFHSGKYKKAIKNYTKLIQIVDDKTVKKTCYINRGLSRDRIKEYDKAIEDFTEAIKLDSTDMASFIDRALSKMHANYLEKAKLDFNYVVNKNSNDKMYENALYWLSRINYSQGNFLEVIKKCNEFLNRNSNDEEIYFIRANAYDMLQNYKKSIKDYTKIINLSST